MIILSYYFDSINIFLYYCIIVLLVYLRIIRGLFNTISVGRLKDQFLAVKVDAALTLFPLIALELWCRALDSAPTVN